jgi:EAL domain-containing protein (putative c-di-GMP-specific phosphodiesterase class I)
MAGIESLIRWQDPVLGLRYPTEFIPVLEESGLILEVGNWIFHEVCSQLQAWRQAGHGLVPVAVNLSPLQFQDRRLLATIENSLNELAIDPQLLTLEITEGSLIHDTEYTRSLLKDFKQLGLQLSLDDFGTGYSSLSYVARYPFQQLKVDISFIRNLASEKTSAAIVSATISMAHELGLKTIAEGVENVAQLDILRQLGCNMIQGFYFSRPLSAEVMGQVLRQNNSAFSL